MSQSQNDDSLHLGCSFILLSDHVVTLRNPGSMCILHQTTSIGDFVFDLCCAVDVIIPAEHVMSATKHALLHNVDEDYGREIALTDATTGKPIKEALVEYKVKLIQQLRSHFMLKVLKAITTDDESLYPGVCSIAGSVAHMIKKCNFINDLSKNDMSRLVTMDCLLQHRTSSGSDNILYV